MRLRWQLVCALTLLGCTAEDPGVSLHFLLTSDYRPGLDFVAVEGVLPDEGVARSAPIGEVELLSGGPREVLVLLDLAPRDARSIELRLLDDAGEAVASSGVRSLPHRVDWQEPIELCRQCQGVSCPQSEYCRCDTEPVCEPVACLRDPTLPDCAARCRSSAECAEAPAACGRAVCSPGGACFWQGDDALCDAGSWCDPELGCRPRPGVPDGGVAPDGGVDVDGGVDAGLDAGTDLPAPTLRFPPNGHRTGSVWTPLDAPIADHPLRPRLMWLPVAGAAAYEIALDDDCAPSAVGCAFASPERVVRVTGEAAPSGPALQHRLGEPLPVSTTAPVGRRYGWRVRACESLDGPCGPPSAARYLDVGRSPGDLNGDGYADLAVGAPRLDAPEVDEGGAWVFYGSVIGVQVTEGIGGGEGLPDPMPVALGNPTDDAGGDFGWFLASRGDADGDGFFDLVVGARRQDGGVGAVYVYAGRDGALEPTPTLAIPSPAMDAGEFGILLATGDLDGDGYDDLAVAAVRQAGGTGALYLYRGGPTGWGTSPDATYLPPLEALGSPPMAFFGLAAIADLDGDGIPELISTSPFTDPAGGHLLVYAGIPGALPDSADPTLYPAGDRGANLGFALDAGDFDGDGLLDAAAGAPNYGPADEGGVLLLARGASRWLESPAGTRSLGNWVRAVGDVDGDGFTDLVVADTFYGTGRGAAFLFPGSPVGPLGALIRIDNPRPTGEFGVPGGGDFDGDGYADLVVGASAQDAPEVDEGEVHVYPGGASGVSGTPDLVFDSFADDPGALFGFALAP